MIASQARKVEYMTWVVITLPGPRALSIHREERLCIFASAPGLMLCCRLTYVPLSLESCSNHLSAASSWLKDVLEHLSFNSQLGGTSSNAVTLLPAQI